MVDKPKVMWTVSQVAERDGISRQAVSNTIRKLVDEHDNGTDNQVVKIIQITRQFLGRKITADMVEAWINSIAFMLRDHKADDDILGYTPASQMFKADKNSPGGNPPRYTDA